MVMLATATTTATATAANYSLGPKTTTTTAAEMNSHSKSTNGDGPLPQAFSSLVENCDIVNNGESNNNVDITFSENGNSTIITSPGPSANIGTVDAATAASGTGNESKASASAAANAHCRDINSNNGSNGNSNGSGNDNGNDGDGALNSATTTTATPLNEKIKDTGEDINVSSSTQNISNSNRNGNDKREEEPSAAPEPEPALDDSDAEDEDPQPGVATTEAGAVTVEGDTNGENAAAPPPMIRLPDNLECLIRADNFPNQRHRWNTNEEIAAILISFNRHPEWLSKEVRIRPKSGSVLLYSRKKVRYRRDGYCWKKRKDGKTTREDHMKLKVQGTECIYGCYVHSAILPTFHRRCYWLLQNPDIVLVHYLNVPYPDDNKLIITSNVSLWGDKKEWTKEELISQLKPMFFSEEEPDLNNKLELSTAETVEAIVVQLMEKQRLARQSLLLDGAAGGAVTNGTVVATGSSTSTGGGRGSRAAASNNNSNNATNTILNDILASAAAAAAASALSATASTAGQSRVSSTSSTSLSPGSSTSSSPLLNGLVTVTVTGGANSASTATSSKPPLTIHLPTHLSSASSANSTASAVPPLITTSSSSSSAVPSITTNHTIMTIPTHAIKLENASSNMNLNANSNASGTNDHGQGQGQGAAAGHARPPFVLNLSQLQTAGGGLIILNGRPATNATNTVPVTTTQLRSSDSDGRSATLMDVQNANTSGSNAIHEIRTVTSSGNSTPVTSNVNFTAANSNNQTLYIHHHPQQQTQFMSSILTTAAVSSVIAAGAASSGAGGTGRSMFTQQQHQSASSRSSIASSSAVNHQHLIPIPDTSSNSSSTSSVFKSDHTDSILLSDHSQYNNNSPSPPPALLLQQSQQAAFYAQETLDMSHEDIQQTLSANMSHMVDSAVDLEPMSPSADDVFINLDAFDILADLSDDLDTQPHQLHSASGGGAQSASSTTNAHVNHLLNHNHPQLQNTISLIGSNDKNTIVDINPEWAYSEGGTKILIVGQFNNPDWDYIVHFGDFPVPAVYVQTGVLKCFCPPHSPGLVPIRVYSNGKQISTNSMVFEYKVDLKVNLVQVPPSETSLKLCLIHRMECVESCFRNFKSDLFGVKSLEDCVVKLCCEMMTQEWCPSADGSAPGSLQVLPSPDRGLSLLHLAAALGYTRFLFTLIQWKRENPAPVLELEVCPLRTDDFGLNPLMWTARYGHLECGIILAQWSPESLTKRDPKGRSPVQIAISRGHSKLATELEKIQTSRLNCTASGAAAADGLNGIGRGYAGSHHHHHELDSANGDSGFGFTNLDRFHRSMSSSVSEDFGLKDCFFGQPDTTLALSLPSEEESRVLTLAEQIIAAMPERIKKESCEEMSPGESLDSSSMISSDQSDQNDLSFEFSDRNYRYYDSGTPSSLSPSSSCLQSPCSSSFTVDSPQPTTADFCEFLQASAFEKDFSNLTLSDREQRELYEAAKVIQKAYRSYKGRKKLEEEEKEKLAAIIIQNYYRRYKQYAYLRQITDAALVIQNQYRNYCENKRFKKSQDSDSGFRQPSSTSQGAMRALSQRKQNQAAKKIQQFMRQSKNKLQKERAERERQQCR